MTARGFLLYLDQIRAERQLSPELSGKCIILHVWDALFRAPALGCFCSTSSSRNSRVRKTSTIYAVNSHDDLFRFHQTFNRATSYSIIIMNEVFNSTSLKDAIFLSTKMIERIIALDMICVCVTFIDELATLSDTIVTMASNVNRQNFAGRTYEIVRRPPDGLAYAISIAEKYRLTYFQLVERLQP